MYQFMSVVLLLVYLALMYFFRENNIVLLLLTLVMILAMCNLKTIEGQGSPPPPSPVPSPNPSLSTDLVEDADEDVDKPSKPEKPKATKQPSKKIKGFENYKYVVADDYQMGPYDNLLIEFDNKESPFVRQLNVPLASRKDLCVYQGNELPLQCNKALFSGMGPSIDGDPQNGRNMFMFYRNKSSPECCPSTFSTSTGCVCTTQEQRDFVNGRGNNN